MLEDERDQKPILPYPRCVPNAGRRVKKQILISISFILLILILLLSSCTFTRIIYHNFSTVDDWRIFPSRPLPASPVPFRFQGGEVKMPETVSVGGRHDLPLERTLEKNKTPAFLVIKDDRLVYERYFNGADEHSISLAFSMTKSFFSLLIGRAIDDGIIGSTGQKVTEYVPELAARGYDRVTIEDLLNMSSGSNYRESDEPIFGDAPWYYYDEELERRVLTQRVVGEPGKRFSYKSADTELLGLILKRALKGETITAYFDRTIWGPLGMEQAGLWSLDRQDGIEKVYCCIAGTARDLAKFGRLALHAGEWDGSRIVSQSWFDDSLRMDKALSAGTLFYRHQWWLTGDADRSFLAIGHLGQFIFVNPAKKVVVVRLGRGLGSLTRDEWIGLMRTIGNGV